ncbi:AraC family transcriptional regulator [Kribbella capetownensis]|uniref:AraC family transcriptional regulator n=1 Tax=Kribbella capetownensis TaxID=1572659 RepID=A0A4R0JHR7_9ACTN|nr:helix-turn-helix domain-containing protein [Kribbella capetownensis]TCC44286.1 AraC family transcriptional regulator [Kribbella capetownensis]
MESLTFESRDLARTEEFLNRAYTKMRIGGGTDDVSARITREAVGSISIDRLDIGFEMKYDADPLGKICLCVVEAGTVQDHATDGWQDAFGPGDVVSFAPPDRPYAGKVCRSRYSITMFDPALLTRAAGVDNRTGGPVRLLDHRPHSAAAARHLVSTINYLGDQVLPDSTVRTSTLLQSSVSRLLASSVLAAFPNTALIAQDRADGRDAHPRTVQRAIAFLESSVDQDVAVGDVAAAAGVTVRAVQTAFQRHLGTTPMAYLRQLRLAEVCTELLVGDPAKLSVTAVAARWGFHHLGRFAAAYRERYGELPSTTLGR